MKSQSRLYRIVYRLINARFSLPTWLWVFASGAVGLIVLSYAMKHDPAIAAFAKYLPAGGYLWGGGLTASAISSIIGMAGSRKYFLRFGSMISFCLWIYGAIIFWEFNAANVAIFAGPMLLFWAYKYLATYVREFPRL